MGQTYNKTLVSACTHDGSQKEWIKENSIQTREFPKWFGEYRATYKTKQVELVFEYGGPVILFTIDYLDDTVQQSKKFQLWVNMECNPVLNMSRLDYIESSIINRAVYCKECKQCHILPVRHLNIAQHSGWNSKDLMPNYLYIWHRDQFQYREVVYDITPSRCITAKQKIQFIMDYAKHPTELDRNDQLSFMIEAVP